ncbi:hypothetical protein TYRP_002964 [Tyrophagus putrescentiae]|nr:hypothetical protein TYRP_002964 [Tyrophagus putrescentiae]
MGQSLGCANLGNRRRRRRRRSEEEGGKERPRGRKPACASPRRIDFQMNYLLKMVHHTASLYHDAYEALEEQNKTTAAIAADNEKVSLAEAVALLNDAIETTLGVCDWLSGALAATGYINSNWNIGSTFSFLLLLLLLLLHLGAGGRHSGGGSLLHGLDSLFKSEPQDDSKKKDKKKDKKKKDKKKDKKEDKKKSKQERKKEAKEALKVAAHVQEQAELVLTLPYMCSVLAGLRLATASLARLIAPQE